MALWICQGCTAAYAVGVTACPQCGSTTYKEDSEMAKINAEGPSYPPGKDPSAPDAAPADATASADAEPAPAEPGAPQDAAAAPDGDGHATPPPPPTQ